MYAIELENISKKFITHYDKTFHSKIEVDSLKNLTIKIETGQVFGIIGRNGSGKTTLLNIIAGIMSPTQGNIKINGKVSSILTLGAGFQPELSGRENIFLNGALIGMSYSEIRKKFYDIVKFSELVVFLDKPLQTYSQGMKMRLGFSVATHIDFDILLVDEILSVGDISFQNKSYEKIEEFRKLGKTMVIVSQSLDIIERLCDKVALLEKGEIIYVDKPQETIKQYKKILAEKCFSEVYSDIQKDMVSQKIRWWGIKEEWGQRVGAREIEITNIEVLNSEGIETANFKINDSMTVRLKYIVHHRVYDPHFGIAIFTEDGVYCYGPNTRFDGYRFEQFDRTKGSLSIRYKNLNLMPGEYRLSIGIWDKKEKQPFDYFPGFYKFRVIGPEHNGAVFNLTYRWRHRKKFLNILDKIRHKEEDNIQHPDFTPNFDFVKYWGRSFGSGGVKIKRIDFSDRDGLLRDSFSHGELMHALAVLEYEEPLNSPCLIWFGIFRADKIYCHGATRSLSANEANISIIYPSIKLLTGRYYLSTAVFKKDGSIIDCQHGISAFDIYTHKKDHGTVYIEHEWTWRFDGQK